MKNKRKRNRDLLTGSVGKHLLRMTLPTIGGMLAFTIFNITDTLFVSKLGTNALAAMGFTFPIVMIVGAFSSGISIGAASVLARAMGKKDHHLMNRIATDGILLSVLSVIFISTIGLLTMDPLFTMLGATQETLPLVKEYMTVWYIGVVAVVMPPVGDSAMRAMGDMIRPFIVMMVCALLNIILDPILIFGLFGFPKMGMAGAALATVISRVAGMITTLSFVHFHYGLIDFKYKDFKELISSWSKILHVGIPSAVVRLFPQLVRTALTKMAATVGGTVAVAAIATGTRVESFATVVSMAIGTALVPIIGQNWGAKKYDRVNETRKIVNKTAVIYGIIIFLIALPLAEPVSKIFTDNPKVLELTKWYLWIVLFASGGLNLYNWTSGELNSVGKPLWVMVINIAGSVVILIPALFIGSKIYGYVGMLVGLGIGQIIIGAVAVKIGKKELKGENEILIEC
ncbi:MATE family efflux transporter [Oceanirhabdus seepicola]|uniref:Probable multidrug resistance protein NorM n=1 Tax=Oceanirhabdus seepicola TaxID=2828781 RepID=A0A9J6P327_9CLOT|nr:MATE family efflux transporter [Oceanirhabdus seepicola]MCM1991154.1 MATE family efflux transporter [Oceanirhabdus seepicola]